MYIITFLTIYKSILFYEIKKQKYFLYKNFEIDIIIDILMLSLIFYKNINEKTIHCKKILLFLFCLRYL